MIGENNVLKVDKIVYYNAGDSKVLNVPTTEEKKLLYEISYSFVVNSCWLGSFQQISRHIFISTMRFLSI